MSLDNYAQINITAVSTVPSQKGFGTLAVLTKFDISISEDLVLSYESASEMITAGFVATEPAYLAVQKAFNQTPKPSNVLVIQHASAAVKTVTFTPLPLNSTTYLFTIKSKLGTTVYQYVSDATAIVAEIITGMDAAIDAAAWVLSTAYVIGDHVVNDSGKVYRCTVAGTSAGSGGPAGTGTAIVDGTVTWTYVGPDQNVTVTDNTTYMTVSADAVTDYVVLDCSRLQFTQADITADGTPGVTADLTAIQLINDDWYGLTMTDSGKPVIAVVSALMEAQAKLFAVTSLDDEIYESGNTTNVAAVAKAAGYDRTIISYHDQADEFSSAAWLGKDLPEKPGSITWMFKKLTGVTASLLNGGEQTLIASHNCNMYITQNDKPFMQYGMGASGVFIDLTRGIDFIHARLQEAILDLLTSVKKVPYTDAGAFQVELRVKNVLQMGVNNELFTSDPAPTVSVKKVATISVADRANRFLPDINAVAIFAGAVHKVGINVSVTV